MRKSSKKLLGLFCALLCIVNALPAAPLLAESDTANEAHEEYDDFLYIFDDPIPLAGGIVINLLDMQGNEIEAYGGTVDMDTGIVPVETSAVAAEYTYEFIAAQVWSLARTFPLGYFHINADSIDVKVPFALQEYTLDLQQYLENEDIEPNDLRLRIVFTQAGVDEDAVQEAFAHADVAMMPDTQLWHVSFALYTENGGLLDYAINEAVKPVAFRFATACDAPVYSVSIDATTDHVDITEADWACGDHVVVLAVSKGIYGISVDSENDDAV